MSVGEQASLLLQGLRVLRGGRQLHEGQHCAVGALPGSPYADGAKKRIADSVAAAAALPELSRMSAPSSSVASIAVPQKLADQEADRIVVDDGDDVRVENTGDDTHKLIVCHSFNAGAQEIQIKNICPHCFQLMVTNFVSVKY